MKNSKLMTVISKRRQRGNMIVNVAIGMGVMAIIVLGSMYGFTKYQDAKVNNDLQELSDLKSSTVKYGQSLGVGFDATNVTTARLAGLNFWDKSKVVGTGAAAVVNNQWGGTVTPAPGNINAAGDSIDYSYTGYGEYACKEIAQKVDTIASRVKINGTQTKANGAATNVDTVITQCENGAGNNTIIYTLAK